MEIISTFIQVYAASLPALLRLVLGLCLISTVMRGATTLWRLRPRAFQLELPPAFALGAIPLLAAPLAPHMTKPKGIPFQNRSSEISPALDERVPPPRSLVRAGELPPSPVHPAVHAIPSEQIHRGDLPRPLFPRIASVRQDTPLEPWERGALDLRRAASSPGHHAQHAAGAPEGRASHYAVLPGDTLWDIAGRVLRTEDQRAIARYWPLIHRENRDIIGPNPNLLRPGQVLTLPRERA
jgi:hypothetical protein